MSSGGPSVETLLYERRRQRLAAGALALSRLEEVIRLVVGAYGVRVAWMPERLSETREAQDDHARHAGNVGGGDDDASAELCVITTRLATMGQHPLLIGDPVRRVIWLSRRPFTMTMQRVTGMSPSPLERVGQGYQRRPSLLAATGATPAESPSALLWEASGPAARVLLAQSDALLSVAPRIAEDRAGRLLRGQRYVLAAPRGIYVTHGDTLTSWAERLLCLPVRAGRRAGPAGRTDTVVRSVAHADAVCVGNVRR